jgi:hypothetical protein
MTIVDQIQFQAQATTGDESSVNLTHTIAYFACLSKFFPIFAWIDIAGVNPSDTFSLTQDAAMIINFY